MTRKWLRFRDLKARGLVNSWPMLKRRIERDGFPPGRMLGPNIRAWTEDEIEEYEDSRPTAGPSPRGAAKARRDRKRNAAAAETTATT
jgi:predicted DNA-binding transcriptional regulator AlpA